VIGFARTPLVMLSETDRVGLLWSLQRCNAEGFYFRLIMKFDLKYELSKQRAFFARLALFFITLATLRLLTH
jgi:hypothetical protein